MELHVPQMSCNTSFIDWNGKDAGRQLGVLSMTLLCCGFNEGLLQISVVWKAELVPSYFVFPPPSFIFVDLHKMYRLLHVLLCFICYLFLYLFWCFFAVDNTNLTMSTEGSLRFKIFPTKKHKMNYSTQHVLKVEIYNVAWHFKCTSLELLPAF